MTEDGWKDNLGLAEDTTKVSIYCDIDHKEAWTEEASEQGRSRSSYLYELIQEARAYRNEGFLGWEHSHERIDELELEVERLTEELEAQQTANSTTLGDPQVVVRNVSTRYRRLDEIVEDFVEKENLESVLRPAVEDTLYALAEDREVEYQRGHGWRLINGGDE